MFEYKGNKFAKLCCDCIANNHAPFTVLYLYGPALCGKTALLWYLESEAFKKELVTTAYIHASAFADGRINTFDIFNNPQPNDVLMIDDFYLLANNQQALSGMEHYIKNIDLQNKKLVLTGNKPLDEYSQELFSGSLLGRLKWEMPVKISSPERADCLNALKEIATKANLLKYPKISDVFNFVLDSEGNNLGRILDTFGRIVARATMAKKDISVEFARDVIYGDTGIELIT